MLSKTEPSVVVGKMLQVPNLDTEAKRRGLKSELAVPHKDRHTESAFLPPGLR